MERLHVRVHRHPGATLFPLLQDVFGHRVHGVPARWRDVVRRALPAGAAAVVGPLLASRPGWIPDRLALVHDLDVHDVTTLEEELASADPALLAEEVATYHAAGIPPAWRPLLDDPAGFVTAYRCLVAAAWAAFAPLWRDADALMGRETERIGLAAVTGGLDGLLAGLGGHIRYEENILKLPHPCPGHLGELGSRPLVLMPLASGYTAGMYGADRTDALWIAYAVPGLGRITGHPGRPGHGGPKAGGDGLSLVLGPVRAEILRSLPRTPTVGELAHHLQVGVSTATYHCQHLEAAGLLRRERHGQRVRLLPTDRGTALTHLLAAPVPPRRTY
ncbi:ArsR/SmtB family transcription factor [Embleya hyalina]|uniref:ArsR/SmtB family transcription factor n=1 Tax=Embleya hyalina TaxID=516124 RepID=UPI000F82597B|nr:winged helix-turn-helix domain-containing protein [Embleya hyalina]